MAVRQTKKNAISNLVLYKIFSDVKIIHTVKPWKPQNTKTKVNNL